MFYFNGKRVFKKNTLSAEKYFEKGKSLVDGLVIIDGTDIFRAGFWGTIQLYRGIGCFKQVIHLEPDNWKAMLFISKCYQSMANYKHALVWAKKAFTCSPQSALAREVGLCAGRMGEFEVGITYIKKAAELSPQDKFLHFNLGVLYLLAGNLDASKKEVKRTLLASRDDVMCKKMLSVIQGIEDNTILPPSSEKELIERINML